MITCAAAQMLVSLALAQPFAYVVNHDADTVSVINTVTHTVDAVVTIGVGSPCDAAVTHDGKFAYIANCASDTVSIVDLHTYDVVTTISLGRSPSSIALSPNGRFAYVANSTGGDISVIDTANMAVTTTVTGSGGAGGNIAFTPNGEKAYVTTGAEVIRVIDTTTHVVQANIDVSRPPFVVETKGVAIIPNGAFAYVSTGSTVSVIDTTTNRVVTTINDDSELGQAAGIALTPDGTFAYVVRENANKVSVIDTATNTVIATVPVEDYPQGVAVAPDGARAYVACAHAISVIDTASNAVTRSIFGVGGFTVTLSPDGTVVYSAGNDGFAAIDTATDLVTARLVPTFPNYVAFAPGGTAAYVSSSAGEPGLAGFVSVINAATHSVTDTVSVGGEPTGVAVAPDGRCAYVANRGWDTISVIDTGSNTVLETIPVDDEPLHIAFTPGGASAYVTTSNGVSVIDTKTHTRAKQITIGLQNGRPEGIVVTPDGRFVYVAVDLLGVVVIDTQTDTLSATVPIASEALGTFVLLSGVAFAKDGALYVARTDLTLGPAATEGRVTVVDAATDAVTATISTPGSTSGDIAVTADGRYAYITHPNGEFIQSNTVSVIDTAINVVVQTIEAGRNPLGIAIAPLPLPTPSANPAVTPTATRSPTSGGGDSCSLAPREEAVTIPSFLLLPPFLLRRRRTVTGC